MSKVSLVQQSEFRRRAIELSNTKSIHRESVKAPPRAKNPLYLAYGLTFKGDLMWVSVIDRDRKLAFEGSVEIEYMRPYAHLYPKFMIDPTNDGGELIIGDGDGVFIRGSLATVLRHLSVFMLTSRHDHLVIDGPLNESLLFLPNNRQKDYIIDLEYHGWPVDVSAWYYKSSRRIAIPQMSLRYYAYSLCHVHDYARQIKLQL